MKRIKLTQSKFAIVDDDDFDRLIKYKWYARFAKPTNTFYAMRNSRDEHGKRFTLLMHRYIMNVTDDNEIDHIDHDTLNNTKKNLRIVSKEENLRNKKLQARNISGISGVTWHKRDSLWRATIGNGEKRLLLGYFKHLWEAMRARKLAELSHKYHRNHGS